jgi:hypothetical protein
MVLLELNIVLLKGSNRDRFGVAVKGGRADCDNGSRIGAEGETARILVDSIGAAINSRRVARGRRRRSDASWFGEDKVGTETLSKAAGLSPGLHSGLDGGC